MKYVFLAFVLCLPWVAFGAVNGSQNCNTDRFTGNVYCYRPLSTRYQGSGRTDYSASLYFQNQSYYPQNNQVCPINATYQRHPVNACICNAGYKVSMDKSMCLKEPPKISNEALLVLMKALRGQSLTTQEKSKKGEIQNWINGYFQ